MTSKRSSSSTSYLLNVNPKKRIEPILRPVEMQIENWLSERPKPARTGLTLGNLGEGGNADAISSTDCEGKSTESTTADPASAPCRSKPWTARHRCPV